MIYLIIIKISLNFVSGSNELMLIRIARKGTTEKKQGKRGPWVKKDREVLVQMKWKEKQTLHWRKKQAPPKLHEKIANSASATKFKSTC